MRILPDDDLVVVDTPFVEVDELVVKDAVAPDVKYAVLDAVDRAAVVIGWSLVTNAVVTKMFKNNEKFMK